ncbi:phosphotransferase [Humibacter albus]|uniref:phosphotransferase n=1 Tax=Humibacter albus TaxID=427754 RepID=UPI0003B705DE|nr:phosphotransferase [Humibacter albus]
MDLIAQGRTADVFDLGEGRVLRRYRDGDHDEAAREAKLLEHLAVLHYPAPHVYGVDGADLVLERVDGGTLFQEMMHEPAQFRRYGRLLGELHARLHRLSAPAWLVDQAGPAVGDAPVIVHRDLHPQNVILSERGPLVIGWGSASAGRAEVDAAVTAILVLGADLGLEASVAQRVEPFRIMLVDAFLETCGVDPRDGLDEAIGFRLSTANNTAEETRWLREEAPDCLDAFYLEPRAV